MKKRPATAKATRRRPAGTLEAKNKKSGSFMLKAAAVSAVIGAVIVISLVIIATLLFDKPLLRKNQIPSGGDFQRQQQLIARLITEINRDSSAENIELDFTETEFASLVKMGVFAARSSAAFDRDLAGQLFPLLYGDISYRGGRFHLNLPLDTGYRWLFGGAVYLDFELKPAKTPYEIDLDIEDLRAGVFPLPDDLTEQILNRECREIMSRPEYAVYTAAIREFTINDDGSVKIICNPRQLLPLVIGGGRRQHR